MAGTLKIMVWNIRDMGVYGEKITIGEEVKKKWVSSVASFIKNIIKEYSLDILVIQELKSPGFSMMSTIVNWLDQKTGGQKWEFDIVEASVSEKAIGGKNSPQTTDISIATLQKLDSVIDCYGVIAKQGLMQKKAAYWHLSNKGYIQLCNQGKLVTAAYPNESKNYFKGINSIEPDGDYPAEVNFTNKDSTTVADAATIVMARPAYRNNTTEGNRYYHADIANEATDRYTARRPAKLCLNGIATNNKEIDLLVFHGPKPKDGEDKIINCAVNSANLCALLSEMENKNVILAGDFNIVNPQNITNIKGLYTNYNVLTEKKEGGYQGSTVRYNDSGTYEKGSPLDLMFAKFDGADFDYEKDSDGFADTVFDLPNELLNAPWFPVYIKNNSVQWLSLVKERFKAQSLPGIIKPYESKIEAVFANATNFPDANTLAVFYKTFISDHLPLLVTLDVK